jgi:hypothetical protein
MVFAGIEEIVHVAAIVQVIERIAILETDRHHAAGDGIEVDGAGHYQMAGMKVARGGL